MIKAAQKNIPLPRKIRALGALRGVNWAEVARNVGVDRTAIYKTIDGKITAHRLRCAVASAVGKMVEEFWPKNNKKAA